jgi:hypothetical protein
MDYSRNGFSLEAMPVKKFNQAILNGSLKERKISDHLYLQYNQRTGQLRRTGWIAYTYNSTVFGKTKKLAIARYKEYHK